MFGDRRYVDQQNQCRYNGYGVNDNYGYGFSNDHCRGQGMFGGRNPYNSYNNIPNYGGYDSLRGQWLGGLFGRGRGLGSMNRFGRSYSAYIGRRGLLSGIVGSVGTGIMAMGMLVGGMQSMHEQHVTRRMAKGKKPYKVVEKQLLWLKDSKSVNALASRIPLSLSLYQLDGDPEGYESRYTVKLRKAETTSLRGKVMLGEVLDECQDDITHLLNFIIENNSVVPNSTSSIKDDWERLQYVCESLTGWLDSIEEYFEDNAIRNTPPEFARLASTALAAVLEQAGFSTAYTVDCKHDCDDESISWCVTDVILHRPDGYPVTVRVDMLDYMFEFNEGPGESEGSDRCGISYSFAAGGMDMFDGREDAQGSGEFTGWSGVQEHIAFVSKGANYEAVSSRGGKLSIPIISTVIDKRRNSRRIVAREQRRAFAFARTDNTDVLFRNLLWYDTKSKPGKVIMKVLPFCLLPEYSDASGYVDKSSFPKSIGYNFLPVEKEYVCSVEDLELYQEEIEGHISYALNFGIVEKDGRYSIHPKKFNSLTDDWEMLQTLTKRAMGVLNIIKEDMEWWLEPTTDTQLSSFSSGMLASILVLAGFDYAVPVSVDGEWTVVDVALHRPKSKVWIRPQQVRDVLSGHGQSVNKFSNFPANGMGIVKQALSDSVVVRVDACDEGITYGYAEEDVLQDSGMVALSTTRQGFRPFTGWSEDLKYKMARDKSSKRQVVKDKKGSKLAHFKVSAPVVVDSEDSVGASGDVPNVPNVPVESALDQTSTQSEVDNVNTMNLGS